MDSCSRLTISPFSDVLFFLANATSLACRSASKRSFNCVNDCSRFALFVVFSNERSTRQASSSDRVLPDSLAAASIRAYRGAGTRPAITGLRPDCLTYRGAGAAFACAIDSLPMRKSQSSPCPPPIQHRKLLGPVLEERAALTVSRQYEITMIRAKRFKPNARRQDDLLCRQMAGIDMIRQRLNPTHAEIPAAPAGVRIHYSRHVSLHSIRINEFATYERLVDSSASCSLAMRVVRVSDVANGGQCSLFQGR